MFLISSYLNQVIWVLSTGVSGEPGDWGGVPATHRPGTELLYNEWLVCLLAGWLGNGWLRGIHGGGRSLWLLGLELKFDLFPSRYALGDPSFSHNPLVPGHHPCLSQCPCGKWTPDTGLSPELCYLCHIPHTGGLALEAFLDRVWPDCIKRKTLWNMLTFKAGLGVQCGVRSGSLAMLS